jgi:hypothetical protein
MSLCCKVLHPCSACFRLGHDAPSLDPVLQITCTRTCIPYSLRGVVYFSDEQFISATNNLFQRRTIYGLRDRQRWQSGSRMECLQVPPFCTNLKTWQPCALTEKFWPFAHGTPTELGFAVRCISPHSASGLAWTVPFPKGFSVKFTPCLVIPSARFPLALGRQ